VHAPYSGPERRRAGRPWAERPAPLRIAVFTTSYPRAPNDPAGRFVVDAVERLRGRGVRVEVIHPALAGPGSLVSKLRRAPWRAPGFLVRSVRALRRADCDLVHAHWLLSGLVAVLAGKPFVITLHGSITAGRFSDFELARRHPRFVGAILRRARLVICVSQSLAEAARACGATDVRVIPNGIVIPEEVGDEAAPAEVLYAGRLSREKGIAELAAACGGMNLVVAGDGPLRPLVPQALGFLSPPDLAKRYRSAAVVVCPSHTEGFGVVCAEAMAHGKPVVATAVDALKELVHHGRTGLVVDVGDVSGLRTAVEQLLRSPDLRRRLGAAARAEASARFAWPAVIDATLLAYRAALAPEPVAAEQPRALVRAV
jgi:glycosyltransferase involved in cell wall biosynthesis